MTTNKQIMVQNVKSIRNLNEKIAILRKMLIKSDIILTRKQSNDKIELKIIELKLNYWMKPKKMLKFLSDLERIALDFNKINKNKVLSKDLTKRL